MGHFPAFIFLIEKTRVYQPARVLGNILKIAFDLAGKSFDGNPLTFLNRKQNRNPPVIRGTLEMPLQLLRRFHMLIIPSLPLPAPAPTIL